METIDGIAFFAIVETSIVPVEVELEDVAAAFKRLLLEVVCCAVVVVAVAVVLPAKWLTAWKVPPATPPNRTALKAMAPIFFASLAAFYFRSVSHTMICLLFSYPGTFRSVIKIGFSKSAKVTELMLLNLLASQRT